ncbi:hypothetical protein Tco_0683426 [Tanacetum coccineum]|uniref:Retroviral polymerase SH3-like domain-containing protein n=1 Tax=Tanacetum coccineum TaxID=301880 RepID=A0ABQ4XUL7_9ASTR
MIMRQYICHTDHNLWDIIVDGDLQEETAPAGEQSSPPAPKTAKQLNAKRSQERVKSILLLAILDEYLLSFIMFQKSKSLYTEIHPEDSTIAKECKTRRNQGEKENYGENGRRNATTNEPSSQALVAQDGLGGYDWSSDFDEPVNYALMAISSLRSSNSSDNEISMSVFEVRSSDEEITPANDRFSKADGYHAVPPPITGNFLTPRADISFAGLDEYAIRKKIIESKTTELNTDTSKSKTSETVGKTNKVNIEKPKSAHESVVPKPKINRDKVIIEDWYLDDEDDVSEVNTVSPVKTNETQTVKTQVDKIGQMGKEQYILLVLLGLGPISTARPVSTARPFALKIAQTAFDENQVVLRAPRQNGVYSLDLKNIVPSGGKPPSISFMRPFGCPLTILNTLDPLGKFDGKSDEGYLLGYSTTSKAFRVYNKRTKRVEENMHIDFLEDQPNVAGSGPDWMLPRISVEDVVQATQEKPSETSPKDTAVQDSEDVAEKEEQHMLTEADQALQDDLERMIAQEIAAKTMDDATRQAFEEEKRGSSCLASINKLNTGRPSVTKKIIGVVPKGLALRVVLGALQVMDTGCRLFLVAGPLFMQFLGASLHNGRFPVYPIMGSRRLEVFLLLVVIIVTVVIVAVILVVVVVAIVGVVIVVAIIGVVVVVGGVSFIIKLSFVIIGSL